jgi:hypothetical protein
LAGACLPGHVPIHPMHRACPVCISCREHLPTQPACHAHLLIAALVLPAHSFAFNNVAADDVVEFNVYDHNRLMKDSLMGTGSLSMRQVRGGGGQGWVAAARRLGWGGAGRGGMGWPAGNPFWHVQVWGQAFGPSCHGLNSFGAMRSPVGKSYGGTWGPVEGGCAQSKGTRTSGFSF